MNDMSSAYNSEDGAAKPWEKPLTADEIRLRAGKWTLADDSQLLAYLEKLSESIVSRTRDVQKGLNNLIHETRVSSVKVNNVINDFNLLSSLQFIENRVYDEEVKEEGNTAQSEVSAPKTKEKQEAALVACITQACQLGIKVVQSALEPLDLEAEGDSDDSEDEGGGRGGTRAPPLLRSQDPYLDRPLPHLIGSEAFLQDEYVGLGDLLCEGDEKSSRGEYESAKSDSEVELEDETKMAPADNRMALMMQKEFGVASEEEREEEMFGERKPVPRKVSKVTTSSSELDSLWTLEEDAFLPCSNKSVDKRGSVSSRKSVETPVRIEKDTDCLFGEPPLDELLDGETASPFWAKKGTFSGPGKLFDVDDEGSPFGRESKAAEEPAPSIRTPKQTRYTESGKKIPAGAVSMLGGLSRLSLGTHKEDGAADESKASATETVSMPKHSNDEDAGLFVHPERKMASNPTGKEQEKEAKSSLMPASAKAEVEDDFFDELPAPKKVTPAWAAVPVSVSRLFEADNEEEDDDLWLTATSKAKKDAPQPVEVTSKPTTPTTTTNKTKPPAPATTGLFDDDGGDLSTSSSGFKKPEPGKKSESFLFDEEEDDNFGGVSKSKEGMKPVTSKSLFIDSTDTEDLFTGDRQPSVPKPSTKGLFLFEDEELPKEETKKVTSYAVPDAKETPAAFVGSKKRSISLFDEEEADDLFISRTPPTQMADSQSSHSIQSATWSSESKENVEPSAVQLEAPTEQPGKARRGSCFLFEDCDKMFAGPTDDCPDVDLFASDKVYPAKKKPIGGVLPFGGADLFSAELKSKLGKTSISEEREAAAPGTKHEEETGSKEDTFFSSAARRQQAKKPALEGMKEASVSFDELVDQGTTLVSATKDRAKIQTKRRLPSRRHHRSNVPPESDDADSSPPREEPPVTTPAMPVATEGLAETAEVTQPASPEVQPARSTEVSSLMVPPVSMVKSPSTEEEDLFSIVENGLKPIPQPSMALKCRGTSKVEIRTLPVAEGMGKIEAVPFGSVFDAEQEADDLFSLPSKRTASTGVFEGASAKPDALFGSGDKAAEGKSEVRPASLPFRENSTEADLFTETAAKNQDLSDDNYDIFSSSGKPLSKKSKEATLFDDDDADDIFASTPTPKRTAEVLQKLSPAAKCTSQSTTFKDPLLHGFDDDN